MGTSRADLREEAHVARAQARRGPRVRAPGEVQLRPHVVLAAASHRRSARVDVILDAHAAPRVGVPVVPRVGTLVVRRLESRAVEVLAQTRRPRLGQAEHDHGEAEPGRDLPGRRRGRVRAAETRRRRRRVPRAQRSPGDRLGGPEKHLDVQARGRRRDREDADDDRERGG
eukprot:30959-Pelagococcus_subviridis.AAC.6